MQIILLRDFLDQVMRSGFDWKIVKCEMISQNCCWKIFWCFRRELNFSSSNRKTNVNKCWCAFHNIICFGKIQIVEVRIVEGLEFISRRKHPNFSNRNSENISHFEIIID